MNSIKGKGSFEIPPEPKAPAASKADQKVSPETPKLSPDQEAAVKEKLKEKSSEDVSVQKKIIGKDVTDFSTTGLVSDKIQQTISKLTSADSKPEISSVDAEISSGQVQKMKSELGLKTPEYSLGSKVPAKAVELHRHPKHVDNREFTFKDFNDTALTNKHAATKLKELINEYKTANGKDPGPREMSKLKEQATQWAFDTYMQGNIDLGLYNPGAMGAEIKRVLGVDDFIPAKINDLGSAMDAIEEELNKFNVPVFLEGRKQSQVLTNELHQLLMHDIKKAMKMYMKVYPDKTWEDAFVFCRDMARNAVYQVIFDKRTFTGSDHGVLHVHHNVQNGDHMHAHMDKGDMSDKAQFLSQVMHFYHDIGYSVGSGKDFNVMKDHPFIGAAFIEANRDYFEHYMGKEETDILKTSILYHAIVSFDSKVGDDLAMVRFTTSNSDACAVAADQKTQSFWREHPETLLSLAKLKLFLTIYPEYASRDKLSHSDIMAHPEKVLDFNNPYDLKAWNVFKSVRDELIAVASQRHLPKEEKEAFVAAIENNFNAFSGEVVLGQYGAELVDVSVVANLEEAGPKYLPAVKMAPSILYAFLDSLYSTEVAGKNIQKVLNEEYYASKEDTTKALQSVGNKEAKSAIVPSPVAHLELVEQTKEEDGAGKLISVIHTLKTHQQFTVPMSSRIALNNLVKVIADMRDGKKPDINTAMDDLNFAFENLIEDVRDTDIEYQIQTIVNKFIVDAMAQNPMTKEKFNTYILDIRTQCSNDKEWEMIGLPSPLNNL